MMEGGDLARVWKGGRPGTLSPLMQAKAWGLSEARVPQVDITARENRRRPPDTIRRRESDRGKKSAYNAEYEERGAKGAFRACAYALVGSRRVAATIFSPAQ